MADEGKDDKQRKCSSRDISELFRNLLESKLKDKPEGKVALFTHAFPDPDALGAMMGVQWIIGKLFPNIQVDLFYQGEISHPQNIAVNTLLDPQLRKVAEYKADDYLLRIVVDTIPANAGTGDHKVDFDLCIDHHKDLPNGSFSGVVIHVKTGACCSIIYKLMAKLCKDTWFEDNNDHDSKTATAIICGIVTDTEYMMSDDSTELEFEAFSALFPFRHSSFLKQIVFFKKPRFWIDVKAKACEGAEIDEEGYAIVGLGLIPDKQRDLIADMAEEMITWASVETAVAFGVIGGERIEGSVRSLNPSIPVSDFCKKLGGKHGTGGGKQGKGAYRYSLGGMSIDPDEDDDTKKRTWELLREKEAKRIKRLISK
jgi:nanoRNase/pAp phosphatase (c-di-AMP/oligoRNAs hydrolase)